jgi:hypothetical protein
VKDEKSDKSRKGVTRKVVYMSFEQESVILLEYIIDQNEVLLDLIIKQEINNW